MKRRYYFSFKCYEKIVVSRKNDTEQNAIVGPSVRKRSTHYYDYICVVGFREVCKFVDNLSGVSLFRHEPSSIRVQFPIIP